MGKILILANNDIGLYKFREELIKELLKENEVFISLPFGEFVNELTSIGCIFFNTEIKRRGINPFTDLKLIIEYNKILKNVNPELVITYTIKPNIYGGLVCRINKVKYATNITGLGTAFQKKGLFRNLIVLLYKISLKKSKIVFFENEDNKNVFINNKIISEEKAFKLNGAGVNLGKYSFAKYPTEKEIIRFLFIGRIMKEKGIDELLGVAEKIKLNNKNVQFDIVGPEEDEYSEILKLLQDREIINYYGYQKDVKPFIERAHCFILPSYHEGMANTLLESGAMGRPLITSNIPGCREAVVDGESGFLVMAKNFADLDEKVTTFIHLSYDQKVNMAKKSRKHIENIFDKKKVVYDTIKKIGIYD